jgi:hypothetical protein
MPSVLTNEAAGRAQVPFRIMAKSPQDTTAAPEGGAELATDRQPTAAGGPARLARVGGTAGSGPAGLDMRDFLAGGETRLRDLLAFGMAAEAGRLPQDGVEGLRRKAEADLHDHAFRLLHNQIEEIRRHAVEEHRARSGGGLSFRGAVGANLLAFVLLALVGFLAWTADPEAIGDLVLQIAQFLARLTPES